MDKTVFLLASIGLVTGISTSHAATSTPTTSAATTMAHPLLLPAGPPPGGGSSPTASMSFFDRNVAAKTIELDLTDGVVMLINVAQNKVTLQKNGLTTVLSLDAAMLQNSNGNASVAASRKAALISELASPDFTARFKAIVTAGSNATSLRNTGLQSIIVSHGLSTKNATYSPMLMPGIGGNTPFGCNVDWDCEMGSVDYGGGGIFDFWFYDSLDSSGGQGTPDWTYWNRWREDQCNASQNDYEDSLADVGALVVGCANVETGVGTLVCVGAGIDVVRHMNKGADDSRNCLSKYSGPGNW